MPDVDYIYLLPFLFLGTCNGLIFSAILFFHKRGNRKANKILAWLVLVLSLSLAESIYVLSGTYQQFPYLISITFPLNFLIGPLFYFYVRVRLKQVNHFKPVYLLHLIPLLIGIIDQVPFYVREPTEKIQILNQVLAQDSMEISLRIFLMMLFIIIQTGVYIYLACKSLQMFDKEVRNYHSDEAELTVHWIKKISIWFTLYLGVHLLTFFLLAAFDSYSVIIDSFIFLGKALFVLTLAFYAIREPEMYSGPILKSTINKKYKKSSLSKDEIKKHARTLLDLMKTEKPYLKSDLRLPELANNLGISTNQLSQVLNIELGMNFFDFVNEYRVNEAKEKLIHPDYHHLSYLAIAYESGFSNKASFNRVFKKHTGKTPTDFVSSRQKKKA